MDLTTIEDEVYRFNRSFFFDISETSEESLDFIDENDLYIPKENYTIVGNFLNNTLKTFRVLDSTFMSQTLKKLNDDVKFLRQLYNETVVDTNDIKEIFEKEFVETSVYLNRISRGITKTPKTPQEIKEQRKLFSMLKELKTVYYITFKEIFNDDKKYFLSSLMQALNSKTYYFDKLLWKEASESYVITKHFQVLKMKHSLNTKAYLLYTTGLMRPYTKEYKYLQSCLRIYK